MKTKYLILVISLFLCCNLYSQINIKGDYVLDKKQTNFSEVFVSIVKQYPLMGFILSDSTNADEVVKILPNKLNVNNNKITFKISDKNQFECKFNKTDTKPHQVNLLLHFSDGNTDNIKFTITDNNIIANWHNLIFKKIKNI